VFVLLGDGVGGIYSYQASNLWIRLPVNEKDALGPCIMHLRFDGSEELYDVWALTSSGYERRKTLRLLQTEHGVVFGPNAKEGGALVRLALSNAFFGGAVRNGDQNIDGVAQVPPPRWAQNARLALGNRPLYLGGIPHVGGPLPKWNTEYLYYATDGRTVRYVAYIAAGDAQLRDYETGRVMSANGDLA
jgi:hypothetical protein